MAEAKKVERGYWADPPRKPKNEVYAYGLDADVDGAEFLLSEDGLSVVVTQEQAMDSYNATMGCLWRMDLNAAKALRDWLNEALP